MKATYIQEMLLVLLVPDCNVGFHTLNIRIGNASHPLQICTCGEQERTNLVVPTVRFYTTAYVGGLRDEMISNFHMLPDGHACVAPLASV